jgi:hypothetical protein
MIAGSSITFWWSAASNSPLSPQKDQGCREAKGTSPSVEGAPPLEQAARISRGGLRQRVHEPPVGRHDHEHRVGPICEQEEGAQQPSPVERVDKVEIGAPMWSIAIFRLVPE